MVLWTHICHPERPCTLLLVTSPKLLTVLSQIIFDTDSYRWWVSGKMLNMISAIYENVKAKVFFQGDKSEEFERYVGVRKGDCLPPFLFAMYINYLEQILIDNHWGVDFGHYKIALLFYADGVYLVIGIECQDIYWNPWKLKINVIKSEILIFKKGRRTANDMVMPRSRANKFHSTHGDRFHPKRRIDHRAKDTFGTNFKSNFWPSEKTL